jgi:hypothetical protein
MRKDVCRKNGAFARSQNLMDQNSGMAFVGFR